MYVILLAGKICHERKARSATCIFIYVRFECELSITDAESYSAVPFVHLQVRTESCKLLALWTDFPTRDRGQVPTSPHSL